MSVSCSVLSSNHPPPSLQSNIDNRTFFSAEAISCARVLLRLLLLSVNPPHPSGTQFCKTVKQGSVTTKSSAYNIVRPVVVFREIYPCLNSVEMVHKLANWMIWCTAAVACCHLSGPIPLNLIYTRR